MSFHESARETDGCTSQPLSTSCTARYGSKFQECHDRLTAFRLGDWRPRQLSSPHLVAALSNGVAPVPPKNGADVAALVMGS